MSDQPIEVEERDGVLWVWLNRPDKRNAISGAMLTELERIVERLEKGFDTRVLVLAARGTAFCAGADLEEGSDGAAALERSTVLFNRIEDLPQPVLAAVNGIACAGGLEILLTTDIIIAGESARFADIHANVGLIPGAGGAYRLPHWVGLPMAKRMLLTGDIFDAASMREAGLVSEVVPDDALHARVAEVAGQLARKSPLGLAAMKRLARQSLTEDRDTAMAAGLEENVLHARREDFAEAMAAFAERRAPVFVGR